jgi:transcriptional regulator GlxA family with amidase domain
MKHVSVLLPEGGVSLSNVEGVVKVFHTVNQFQQMQGKPALFTVHTVGLPGEVPSQFDGFTISPNRRLNEVEKTDLIVIPAIHGDMQEAIALNEAFYPWIIRQHQKGAEIVSLCLGAFLLASTGLLNGRRCTTHWMAVPAFRQLFPECIVVEDQVLTDECGIYSSGGAYSFLNLLLYLGEKYGSREAAIFVAKIYEIDLERSSQSPFIIFEGQKRHQDEDIARAQAYIEQHIEKKIAVDNLASLVALSRRTLERRFKRATAYSITDYIQRVKIEIAKSSLESSRANVQQVMDKVGYSDGKAFRSVFKRVTGLSPMQYRKKYNRAEI